VKITDVRAHVLAAPLDEPIRMAFGAMHARTTVLVEVVTSAGLSGWGEELDAERAGVGVPRDPVAQLRGHARRRAGARRNRRSARLTVGFRASSTV